MALYDYRCASCGVVVEIERPMSAAEHESGLVQCTCGEFEWKRIYYAPQVIAYGDPTIVNPNPVERAKREADMGVMVPRERYVNQVSEHRLRERQTWAEPPGAPSGETMRQVGTAMDRAVGRKR